MVHFGEPAIETFNIDYAALPGRLELAAAMLVPFRKKLLPAAPSAVNVLWRSLVAHQRYDTLPAAPLDHIMRPPIPPGVRVTEFERHTEIFDASYAWARSVVVPAKRIDDGFGVTATLATVEGSTPVTWKLSNVAVPSPAYHCRPYFVAVALNASAARRR